MGMISAVAASSSPNESRTRVISSLYRANCFCLRAVFASTEVAKSAGSVHVARTVQYSQAQSNPQLQREKTRTNSIHNTNVATDAHRTSVRTAYTTKAWKQ